MNMISTGAFLTEMDASNKQPTVAEKFAAVWEKKNAKAARAGGVSLMALSLAACGGSSSTTTTTDDTTSDTTTDTTTVTPASLSLVATKNTDTLEGGAGDDTFSAFAEFTTGGAVATADATLDASDTYNGGAGTDTLTITVGEDPTGATNLAAFEATGMEVVQVRNVSGTATTAEMANVGGLTEVVNLRSTNNVDFDDIGTADVTVVGNDVVTNGDTTFSSGSSSQTDAFTLNIKDGVGAGAITSNSANDDWTAVTINSTGGTETSSTNANVVGALDLAGGDTMQTLTVNATSSLTTGAIIGWDTATAGVANKGAITVTGAGKVNLNTLNAAVESLDASDNSGGVTVTLSTQTDFQYVGSTGADIVTTGAVLSTSTAAPGSVNAGAGADRLVVSDSTHVTSTVGAKYTNFETLQVNNGVSVDLDHLSGITDIRINGAGTATGVTDMSAAQAANVTLVAGAAGVITLGVKSATTIGQTDTVTIAVDDGSSTANDIVLTAPVMTGVENLVINAAADAVSISALTSAASLTSIDINATHASSVETEIVSGAVAFGANTTIDASDSTDGVVINISDIVTGTGSSAVSITGGSGGDTITTSGVNADTVAGNGGTDVITITNDAGLTGSVTVISTTTASADADHVVGFISAEDIFDYNGTLSNGTGAAPTIAATEVASATTFAGALATADANNDIVFIATTDLTGASETAMDNYVAGPTAALASTLVDAMVGTGGALNGAIASLDSVLGASDVVLAQFSTDSDTFIFRIANTDTTTSNTLTAAEVSLVAAFDANDLVAADYVA